jgi:UDP-glucose 4-epimerase
MPKKKVFLVTGAAGEWGKRICTQLISQPGIHVIGLDKVKPAEGMPGLDFIQADMRNSLIDDLLKSEKVDAVCHLAFIETQQPSEEMFDFNVMGTMKLLAACSNADVKKVVIKSSMAVYGAKATNSSFLTEAHVLNANRSVGELRDLVEIEAFCNGFRRKAPDLTLTVLRFPGILGPTADTSLSRYLKEPLVPVLMGFDPRMQIIHEEDVTGALMHALLHELPGTFNVAAEGILPLLRVIALAGKIPLPVFHLFAYWGKSFISGTGNGRFGSVPNDLDSLRYDWVGDLKKMHDEFGFTPKYTAEETLREFAGILRVSPFKQNGDDLKRDEERLRDTLDRRQREKTVEPEIEPAQPERRTPDTFDQDDPLTDDLGQDEEIEGA